MRQGENSFNMIEKIGKSFHKTVEEETKTEIPSDERVTSIAIVVICVLFLFYSFAHYRLSTGFFTASYGTLEMVLLYGSIIYWIITSTVMILGRKDLSRDIDSFGGLIFATVGFAWVLIVFPFEFSYFSNVLPDFFRFLLRWISNDIARVLMLLAVIVHLVAAVYSAILRVFVYKSRARNNRLYRSSRET
jgi:magnesium-transporting ATPase (P-type)